jgi:hypothetical protein
MATIRLGCHDPEVTQEQLGAYLGRAHEPILRGEACLRGESDGHWASFVCVQSNEVASIQTFLKDTGFFPRGAVDSLCGYRTVSSMRLFQEYVRVTEGDASIGAPDGVFGPKSLAHVARWKNAGLEAAWVRVSAARPDPEYARWLALLERTKAHYLERPTTLLERIAALEVPSDTRAVADWRFDRDEIHIIGIRRDEAAPGKRLNDDVFVTLIDGLVFKFYGTTDPGKSSHRDGAPFLVHGQHEYRFGWHKISDMQRIYRALKPARHGVLVVRDGDRDDALTEHDLAGALEPNASINVHWGGRGVSNWSEGCQCICGAGYINFDGRTVDCRSFAAARYVDLGASGGPDYHSKGAYSVLVDLVTAFSEGRHAATYTLLYERDLELDPAVGAAAAREILSAIS